MTVMPNDRCAKCGQPFQQTLRQELNHEHTCPSCLRINRKRLLSIPDRRLRKNESNRRYRAGLRKLVEAAR